MVRKVTSVENNDEEDCAPVPTFQSAFTEALGAAGWTGNGVNPEGQGEVAMKLTEPFSFDVKMSWTSVAVLIHNMFPFM